MYLFQVCDAAMRLKWFKWNFLLTGYVWKEKERVYILGTHPHSFSRRQDRPVAERRAALQMLALEPRHSISPVPQWRENPVEIIAQRRTYQCYARMKISRLGPIRTSATAQTVDWGLTFGNDLIDICHAAELGNCTEPTLDNSAGVVARCIH